MNQPIPLSVLASTAEIFLGRQPILDHKKQIVAYELLFRSKGSLEEADVNDDLLATSTVIVNTLSQFGLEQVLGNKLGFLNVSASLLLSETVNLLPPDRIVLEILEDVPVNAQIITRCKQLKEMGFKLALDDFEYRSEHDALFPIIDYVKIDLTITPFAKLPEICLLYTSIVGSPNSSNSNRLREVAQNQGVEAYMVDNASHLDPEWLIGKKKIGVSAGASAPEVLVQEVIEKLQRLGAHHVVELHGVVENVVFQLPKNLTSAKAKEKS